ncbi:MAG: hypothetical protein HOL85_05990 [Rhodospirillaceae bacterium]|jgi:hypothetical protein|nr:hypothetical protein [Rhodospirillaceae bacterium]MBT6139864.1 hypothetical protein [Rhodospirillaceae bacterium]
MTIAPHSFVPDHTPTQAEIDAGIARGRRLQADATLEFFGLVAKMLGQGWNAVLGRGTHRSSLSIPTNQPTGCEAG